MDTPPIPVGPRVERVLETAYQARLPVLLEGRTGIGKSELLEEVTRKLGIRFTVIDLSVLEPSDLIGIPARLNGMTVYAPPESLPREGSGIIVLEELNRCDPTVRQPALQFLTYRMLHAYRLPDDWTVCAAINPETEDYQVSPLDPALRARFLNLSIRADRKSWLDWARANGVHPAILRVAEQHDDLFEEISPRSWTYASRYLQAFEARDEEDLATLYDGLIGYLRHPAWVETVLQARENLTAPVPDVHLLVSQYHREPEQREQITHFLRKGQTDRLRRLARDLEQLLECELGALAAKGRFELAAFERLLADLPGDLRERLQDTFARSPAAASLLAVEARDILDGYVGSEAEQIVESWLRDDGLRHRVQCLTRSLLTRLEQLPDLSVLLRRRRTRAQLEYLIEQLGPELAEPLTSFLRHVGGFRGRPGRRRR